MSASIHASRPGHQRKRDHRISLAFVMLVLLVAVLLLTGGAARSDVYGQVIARAAAWAALIVAALFGQVHRDNLARVPSLLLAGAIAIPLLQLIPLPPAAWAMLPGREFLLQAAPGGASAQPWRPWSLTPSATMNAASSLVVPTAALVLVAGLRKKERDWLPTLLLGAIVASMVIAMLQVSGAGFLNPLIGQAVGQIAGSFSNPNHFALFMALGCVLAPGWAFRDERKPTWRAPVSAGLLVLFVLMILASGSRVGMIVGILGIILGLATVRRPIRRMMKRYPRWVLPVALASLVLTIMVFIYASIASDRAVSINRIINIDASTDMRTRSLPVVLNMIGQYFPFGSGLGSFDPIFRMHEPFDLLKPTYFNHAHNDFLEIVLDSGIFGLVLLVAAISWWLINSIKAWRGATEANSTTRLGGNMLLLILLASAFDYPARTPLMMATIVITALLLAGAPRGPNGHALPAERQHL